jgi:hypothetical protein
MILKNSGKSTKEKCQKRDIAILSIRGLTDTQISHAKCQLKWCQTNSKDVDQKPEFVVQAQPRKCPAKSWKAGLIKENCHHPKYPQLNINSVQYIIQNASISEE